MGPCFRRDDIEIESGAIESAAFLCPPHVGLRLRRRRRDTISPVKPDGDVS
jgi:hypothetical protein